MSEYLPYNIWLISFLTAQGYGIKKNMVYQDNQIELEWRKMGGIHALVIPGIITYVISSLRIEWIKDSWKLNNVQLRRCWQITS